MIKSPMMRLTSHFICMLWTMATLSSLGEGPQVVAPFEGRLLCLEDGSMEETFDPLGVHIYP